MNERLEKIAAALGVTVAELTADRYTYMPGMCITCEAVYEDVHFDRIGYCTGCTSATVWPWSRIVIGAPPSMVAIRNTCFRAVPRLRLVDGRIGE